MVTTGVIHEEASNWRRPVLQHTNKAALREMLCDLLFICEAHAGSSECGLDNQMGIIDYEWAVHADRNRLSSLLEFPPIRPARKTQAYASMIIQILGLARNV